MNASMSMPREDPVPDHVLKTRGRSFHFARRFLGQHHGQRAARLYAFCRHVDDVADDAVNADAALSGLSRLEAELRGQCEAGPHMSDFLRLADDTRMDLAPAGALIAGVRGDVCRVAFVTERELVRYAYHVAGAVGLMMCAVLEVDNPAAAPFAIDLGIAMQLTNIARDVGEDARMGRRYLPSDWVGAIEPSNVLTPDGINQRALKGGVERLLELAARYYRSGEAGLGHLPPRARFAILVASRVYAQIGRAIAQMEHETWRARAHVTAAGKVLIAGRAAADFLTDVSLHRKDARHDERLHLHLQGLTGANVAP